MTRKISVILTMVCMIVFLALPVHAESGSAALNPVESPEVRIIIDGKAGTYDVSPITVNGRVLLPLRAIFTNLGVPNDDKHIIWNGSEQKVTVYRDTDSVELKIDSTAATVNGKSITLDVPAVVYKDRTYVPARFVSQSLGKKVFWDDATKSVIISGATGYSDTKSILEKAIAATDGVSQVRNERSATVKIEYMTVQSMNETSAVYLMDKKRKITSGNIKTIVTSALSQRKENQSEMWYEKGTLYSRDSNGSEWSSLKVDEAIAADLFDTHYLLTGSDTFYGGLKVETGSDSNEIVLAGDISAWELFQNSFNTATVKDIKPNSINTRIVIDKNTYYIKKISVQSEGKMTIGGLEPTFKLDITITNSNFNENLDMKRPEELNELIAADSDDYDKGMELLDEGKTEEAIAHFDKAIAADPSLAKAYKAKAGALYWLRKYEDSNAALEKALPLDSKDAELIIMKARNLAALNQGEKALELCEKALVLDSKSEFAYYVKGIALNSLKKYKEALEAIDKALELDPKFEDAHIWKVSLLYNMENYEECIAAAGKAQQLFPENVDFPWYAGDAYFDLYKYEEAIKQYELALKIDPENDTVYAYMGLSYYYLQNYDKALECAQNALKINSNNGYATQLVKMAEEAKLPEAQRIVNFVKANYLYIDKVQDFDKKSADFMAKTSITADDVKGFIKSIKLPDDIFTYVLTGKYYEEMVNEENASQITSRTLEKNGHYVRINMFTKTVGAEFKKIIDGIQNSESKTLVIDLRDNGGGLAAAANDILDLLLPQVVTSYTVDRDGYMDQNYSDASQVKFKKILVLVNENSASSSELLALGLKKYLNNVVIIGQPTFGKGVGQNVFENKEKGYMVFLVNFYWNVREQNIAGSKITPDVVLQGTTDTDFFNEISKQMAN